MTDQDEGAAQWPEPADLADRIDELREGGPIGHSMAAHAVHGWCALCPGKEPLIELAAWRNLAHVEAATAAPRRTGQGGATVVVDFDGVLHTYDQGWRQGAIYGGPVAGSREAVHELLAGYAVVVGTARPDLAPVAAAIRDWYDVATVVDTPAGRYPFWSVRGVILVTGRKMPALAYIDDRGIRLEAAAGGWGTVMDTFRELHTEQACAGPPVIRPVRA